MAIKRWPRKEMKLTDLVPMEDNPRGMDDVAMVGLTTSLEQFGMLQPIVWNKRTGHIVGGHQRYFALMGLGEIADEVIVVDVPEPQERAMCVVLNNPRTQGYFLDALDTFVASIKLELPDLPVALRLDEITIPDISDISGSLESETDDGRDAIDSREETYQIIVTCVTSAQQIEMVERLEAEGIQCRVLA